MISGDLRSEDGTECTVCIGNILHQQSNFLTLLDRRCTFLAPELFHPEFSPDSKLYTAFGSKVTFCPFLHMGYSGWRLSQPYPYVGSCTLSETVRRSVRPTISSMVRNTKSCHIFSQLLCNKAHEVLHILRFSAESSYAAPGSV